LNLYGAKTGSDPLQVYQNLKVKASL